MKIVDSLICAEVRLAAKGDKDGARVIRNERMKLQSAIQRRDLPSTEKTQSIRRHTEEAIRVASLWSEQIK